MTKNFTPGPWERRMYNIGIADTGDVDGVVDVVDENGRTIAYVQYGSYSNDHSDEECEANGLLIALCPDMYEVIKELLKFNEALDDDFGQGIIASEDTGKIYECILEKARQIKQKVEIDPRGVKFSINPPKGKVEIIDCEYEKDAEYLSEVMVTGADRRRGK